VYADDEKFVAEYQMQQLLCRVRHDDRSARSGRDLR